MEPETPKVHMGSEIHKCLDRQKRSVTWLADELNYDQSNLNKILQKPNLRTILLFRISKVLGVDLFAWYSKELADCSNKKVEEHVKHKK